MTKSKLLKILDKAELAVKYFFVDRKIEKDERATIAAEQEIRDGIIELRKIVNNLEEEKNDI